MKMDTSLKLQLDVKNNAQELQSYMLDLNNWEEEMKRKELALLNEKPNESVIPPPRNKSKRNKPENDKKQCTKPKKISAYDYSAWDKYDVEKALAEIDKEDNDEDKNEEAEFEENTKNEAEGNKCDDSDLNQNEKFSLVDEAFYEKEMGNQFVKKEQWTDAIKCYTNAINLDSNNPIYYANRSLCFLKLKNFKFAETDATTAIQLDKKYVKAYQRRAFARQILGQLIDAKSDFEEILKLEPKNALARVEINKINEKLNKEQGMNKAVEKQAELDFNPKNMFNTKGTKSKITQSVDINKIQPSVQKTSESSKNKTAPLKPRSKNSIISNTEIKKMDINESINVKNEEKTVERGDGDKIVSTEPTKLKSDVFKPLPQWCKIIQPINLPPHKRSKKSLKRIDIAITDKDEDSVVEEKNECSNVVERREEKIVVPKNYEEQELKNERLSLDAPKTAIQFYNCWKILRKNPKECYSYLKKISASELPQIFENSLESDFFSQIVTFLANDEIEKEPEFIYNFLWGLSKVKRFNSLILFMSEAERKCVRKAISETEKVKSAEEIHELIRLYEFKA